MRALSGILLARHGETDDNREPLRFQGFRDTPLNETGRRQAAELAERVAGDGIVSLWSSDLSRARETAQIVGARIGLAAALDPRLREANRGRWEGQLFRDIAREEPERYAAWLRAGASFRFPGGESLQDQLDRVSAALARHPPRRGELPALVVCHGGSIRVMLCRARSARPRRVPRVQGPERRGGAAVSRLPVAAFGALVVATVAAFFVTQHLKVTTPLITGVAPHPRAVISPRHGGVCGSVDHRVARISFYLQHRSDDVDVYVVDKSGTIVRTLASGGTCAAAPTRCAKVFPWNGREDNGRSRPTGRTTSGSRCSDRAARSTSRDADHGQDVDPASRRHERLAVARPDRAPP